ncbi:hypothetical protein HanXRQr2_Chr09g0411311 [Helianthus annuus]|uniref:Uncharacterized protein n=1 Tax=Helianthus annuus TaxID=4232 RepID=A0A9K3I9C6_HELAN|nr:hypothetical protein HanXRQr2_Chr09g0411311 [Helianthus annuus]KAJ0544226.1 hypothetical protein HanHA89_Chr09g0359201 [Helianthus annuus]
MDLLLCYLANNPQVLKGFTEYDDDDDDDDNCCVVVNVVCSDCLSALFVGDANSCETISNTKLQFTFPKMINTIADECEDSDLSRNQACFMCL